MTNLADVLLGGSPSTPVTFPADHQIGTAGFSADRFPTAVLVRFGDGTEYGFTPEDAEELAESLQEAAAKARAEDAEDPDGVESVEPDTVDHTGD